MDRRAVLAICGLGFLAAAGAFAYRQGRRPMTPVISENIQDAETFFSADPAYQAIAVRIAREEMLQPADLDAVAGDIDKRFLPGQFRLITFAWRVGNLQALDVLLARGANPLAPLRTTDDPPQQNLVYRVLTSEEPKAAPALRALLRHGLSPNYVYPPPSSAALLSFPLLGANTQLVGILLDAGANPWARDSAGLLIEPPFSLLHFGMIEFLLQRKLFVGQPASNIKPLVDDLAGPKQTGDASSLTIQRLMRELIDQSHYPSDDPNVRYVLSGGKDGG